MDYNDEIALALNKLNDKIPIYGQCPAAIGSDGTAQCYCTGECKKIIGWVDKDKLKNILNINK